VPLLSEIIEGVREKEGIRDSGTINDKASGVYNTAYAVGCIIAPILGGYLSMYTNFRTTCDIMAICSISYAAIFFSVIILPSFCYRGGQTMPSPDQTLLESPNGSNPRT